MTEEIPLIAEDIRGMSIVEIGLYTKVMVSLVCGPSSFAESFISGKYKVDEELRKRVIKKVSRHMIKEQSTRFIPPSIDEIKEYCVDRKNSVDAECFHDFYQAKGWLIGKTKMKDWRAAVRTWEKSRTDKQANTSETKPKRQVF